MLTQPTAYISQDALRHNLAVIRKFAPQSRIMAMVKANAYGHGASDVADTLVAAGVDALAVARMQGGINLRQHGITIPIVVLCGALDISEVKLAEQYHLDLVIHQPKQVTLHLQHPKSARIWLKINTGMNRLGLKPDDALTAYQMLIASNIDIAGIISHFSSSEESDGIRIQQQIACFNELTHDWPYPKSLANSAAIMTYPETHMDWIRPGIMLYGISPFPDKTGTDLGLQPVMQFQAPLCAVYPVKQGEGVGYNATFICPEDMLVGIIRVGYGDGYPRYLRHSAQVMIANQPAPVIGRVSMDLLAIDLRGHTPPELGTHVTLWGPTLPIEHLAKAAETSPYELVAGLTARVEYRYLPS